MVKTIAYILLFVHINTTLFIPVVDEKDMYDVCGRQIDDVNTIFEYIDQVILGHTDYTPEDEDDDQPHYFTGSSGISYYISCQEQTVCCINEPTTKELAVAYPLSPVQKTSSIAYDILTPPPEV
ncbi:hypothetical protein SAMN05518672_112117 [Chitinophaga sp. CF118]|uniref:hypothetical protein n=1 Tax=Chitinophaga sp. CF118 TaxID=1884367 RepID=UPI0008E2400C|nr:hypothetical protein [Chitinophaga sp. CF118]SFE93435.1 hypothetical protein SAMN05518672_112117 [Chitinophaga sp. CF118]